MVPVVKKKKQNNKYSVGAGDALQSSGGEEDETKTTISGIRGQGGGRCPSFRYGRNFASSSGPPLPLHGSGSQGGPGGHGDLWNL